MAVGKRVGELSVDGPMARSVADVALLLGAMAGHDDRSPIALDSPSRRAVGALDGNVRGTRVAWWSGLRGMPIEREIAGIVNDRRAMFDDLGCIVSEAEPDLSGADDVFKTLRALAFVVKLGDLVQERRSEF